MIATIPPAPTTAIRSIQGYSITIGASSTSNTATLGASVTTAKAVIDDCGAYGGDATDIREGLAHVVLTDSTTVTATRSSQDGIGTLTVRGYVVEYR